MVNTSKSKETFADVDSLFVCLIERVLWLSWEMNVEILFRFGMMTLSSFVNDGHYITFHSRRLTTHEKIFEVELGQIEWHSLLSPYYLSPCATANGFAHWKQRSKKTRIKISSFIDERISDEYQGIFLATSSFCVQKINNYLRMSRIAVKPKNGFLP